MRTDAMRVNRLEDQFVELMIYVYIYIFCQLTAIPEILIHIYLTSPMTHLRFEWHSFALNHALNSKWQLELVTL